MKIETLKKSHLKRNIIIGVGVILIISAVILNFTRAKYRTTQSIPLVNGTINYTPADFNAVAIYVHGDSGYTKTDTIPDGYVLNESESYCTVNGEEDINISLSYDTSTKSLSVTPMTTKGTKCYLYFDEKGITNIEELIANYSTVKTRTFPLTASSKVEGNTTGVIYKSADSNQYDNDGEVYYFAGNPTDNWVKWAGFYWRIIRINGNGSIRMIYQGTSPNTTGTDTQLQTSKFNSSYNRSEYVGLKYTTGSQHGTGSNSTIMGVLNTWYSENIEKTDYVNDIDTNVGFCSDRNMGSGYSWSSQPSSTIYYAAYGRLVQSSSNVLKIPVGLITADEVVMAGLPWNGSTTSNYLYTGQHYWTMSPSRFRSGSAIVFCVFSYGQLNYDNAGWTEPGVRPVVNLKSSVQITGGNGTADLPFEIAS